MTDFEELFRRGKPNREKLLKNGFTESERGYFKESRLLDFLLRTRVSKEGRVSAELIDRETDAPYTLHLVPAAQGSFVGEVRTVYENALFEVAENCFDRAAFASNLVNNVIEYAYQKYGESCEYLWERSPDNGILRRKDNRKWYAALLTVAGNKVGLSTDRAVEIVDLRAREEDVKKLLCRRGFAPAYHMNKKHWITVLSDGAAEFSAIEKLIDESRELALKK